MTVKLNKKSVPAAGWLKIDLSEKPDKNFMLVQNITVKPGSVMHIFENGRPEKKTGGIFVNLTVGECARVTYTIAKAGGCLPGLKIERRVKVKKDGSFSLRETYLSGRYLRSNTAIELIGEGAEASIHCGLLLARTASSEISHVIAHVAPRTKSCIIARAVLKDSAHAKYQASIRINPNVPGCCGRQRADFLLLSPQARVETAPELEIGNSDVQCSHAVTITRLNPDRLFYLASRGLTREEAAELLANAHLAPIWESEPAPYLSPAGVL